MSDPAKISGPTMVAHVFCLCALVISKPLFDLFSAHPEYFVVNRLAAREIFSWVLILIVLVPLAVSLTLFLIRVLKPRLRFPVYLLWVAFFTGIFALQLSKQLGIESAYASVLLAGALSAATLLLLALKPQVSFGITLLTPVIAIFPLLFIFSPSIQAVLDPESTEPVADAPQGAVSVARRPPIFFVVFDEFALVDLLDPNGDIDARRFPNIAAFADEATWFENATTVRHATTWAVPAILTGNQPKRDALPRHEDYPRNLFSMLRPHYDFHVIEPATQLDSQGHRRGDLLDFLDDTWVVYLHLVLPDRVSGLLPPVGTQWGGFRNRQEKSIAAGGTREKKFANGQAQKELVKSTLKDRAALFEQFLGGFDDSPSASLHFLHILLPHGPTFYLPSGRRYSNSRNPAGVTKRKRDKAWLGEQTIVDKLHQRHLLQVGYVDTLWGRMIDKIKSMGVYDESLIIMVADHGISFQANVSYRRPSKRNFAEIAFVPLMIKFPDQTEGRRDTTNVETIDIVPTLVDVLGVDVPWAFDGRSLVDPGASIASDKQMPKTRRTILSLSEAEYLGSKRQALARNVKTFRLNDPRSTLFNYENGLELVGAALRDLESRELDCSVRSKSLKRLRSMAPDRDILPLRITGELECGDLDGADPLVVFGSIGEVIAVTRPYSNDGKQAFDHVVPDEAVVRADNQVSVRVIDY